MNKTAKKLLVAGALVIALLQATSAFAAPGYYIGGKKYLSTDLAKSPALKAQFDLAVQQHGYNNLLLDLDDRGTVNYGAYMAANPGPLNMQKFKTFAASSPATPPPNAVIVNPDLTETPDPETVVLDTAPIDTAITGANAAKAGVVISVDGQELESNVKWVTQAASDALDQAIAAAAAVKTSAKTQQEITNAASTLNGKIAEYVAAKKDGMKVNTEAIDSAITAANQAKKDVKISTDGSDVADQFKWVTQEASDALDQAIAEAEAVKTSAKTQQEITNAASALNGKIAEYVAAKKDGMKVNTEAIDSAITAANQAKKDVKISTDGSDVLTQYKWVTQEASDALDQAIATATAAKTSAKRQQEVTIAVTALNEAIATYENAKQDGTL